MTKNRHFFSKISRLEAFLPYGLYAAADVVEDAAVLLAVACYLTAQNGDLRRIRESLTQDFKMT